MMGIKASWVRLMPYFLAAVKKRFWALVRFICWVSPLMSCIYFIRKPTKRLRATLVTGLALFRAKTLFFIFLNSCGMVKI